MKDTGFIPLKPLNVIVGANSSGKSTFLRFFTLLHQSAYKPIRGDIAWVDESMVDFGDYKTAFNRYADSDAKLRFSFRLKAEKNPKKMFRLRAIPMSFFESIGHFYSCDINIEITYSSSSDGRNTFISELKFHITDSQKQAHTIYYNLSDRNNIEVTIDGTPVESCVFSKDERFENRLENKLIPYIDIKRDKWTIGHKDMSMDVATFPLSVVELLKPLCSSSFTHTERLKSILDDWTVDKKKFIKKASEDKNLPQSLRNSLSNSENISKHPAFDIFYQTLYTICFTYIGLSIVNDELVRTFTSTEYVAPLRAAANRYYRYQNLQSSVLDPFGKNLADYISSFTDKQKSDYDAFMRKVLGASIRVGYASGHQSINIVKCKTEADGQNSEDSSSDRSKEMNITDVGFGYSQILPILTKIWEASWRNKISSTAMYRHQPTLLITIEQPELHLHPALQARLADAIMKVATDKNTETTIILETHSPTILNRIGLRIAEEKVSPEDISVLIFNKSEAETEISQVSFDNDGRLTKWPYGFFDPDDDEF